MLHLCLLNYNEYHSKQVVQLERTQVRSYRMVMTGVVKTGICVHTHKVRQSSVLLLMYNACKVMTLMSRFMFQGVGSARSPWRCT